MAEADERAGAAKEAQRAFGRSLHHFYIKRSDGTHALLPSGEKLLEAVRDGKLCCISESRPSEATEDIFVVQWWLKSGAIFGERSLYGAAKLIPSC